MNTTLHESNRNAQFDPVEPLERLHQSRRKSHNMLGSMILLHFVVVLVAVVYFYFKP